MLKISQKDNVINFFLLLIFFIFSLNSHASWLCREASSEAENDYFYSCGVAKSKELYEARKQALLNAKEEFNSFCNESYNCKNNEYIVSPMRTDCKRANKDYICYRSLQYRILDKKREHSNMSLSELKREVIKKESELKEINERIANTDKLSKFNSDILYLENADETALELDKLSNSYQTKLSQGVFALKFSSMNMRLRTHTTNIFSIGLEYERFIYSDVIGYTINMSYLTGTKNDAKLASRGTPNTTSESDYHSHQGYDLAISFPIHFYSAIISPKYGYSSIIYDESVNMYNSFGVALNSESNTHNVDNNYYGVNFKYGDRFFAEIEPRKYSNQDGIITSVGIGIKIYY